MLLDGRHITIGLYVAFELNCNSRPARVFGSIEASSRPVNVGWLALRWWNRHNPYRYSGELSQLNESTGEWTGYDIDLMNKLAKTGRFTYASQPAFLPGCHSHKNTHACLSIHVLQSACFPARLPPSQKHARTLLCLRTPVRLLSCHMYTCMYTFFCCSLLLALLITSNVAGWVHASCRWWHVHARNACTHAHLYPHKHKHKHKQNTTQTRTHARTHTHTRTI